MPRADDPRVSVRLSPESYAAIKAAADRANVSVGALIRECAERSAMAVARDVAAGDVRLRRARVDEAVRASVGGRRARALVDRESPAGLMMQRQLKMNADRPKPRAVKR